MDAEECRRSARHFLAVARNLGHLEEQAQMLAFAAYWLERAVQADECRELFSQR